MGTYRERLGVPASYWLLAVPLVILLGSEGYFFAGGYFPALGMGALLIIVAAFLLRWGGTTIEVADGVLRAGRDVLPLSTAAEVIALSERQAARLRGPQADPAAHLLLRPYLKRAVCVRLAAADGQAPYWLVATRHPERLATAIDHARQADGTPRTDSRRGGPQSVG